MIFDSLEENEQALKFVRYWVAACMVALALGCGSTKVGNPDAVEDGGQDAHDFDDDPPPAGSHGFDSNKFPEFGWVPLLNVGVESSFQINSSTCMQSKSLGHLAAPLKMLCEAKAIVQRSLLGDDAKLWHQSCKGKSNSVYDDIFCWLMPAKDYSDLTFKYTNGIVRKVSFESINGEVPQVNGVINLNHAFPSHARVWQGQQGSSLNPVLALVAESNRKSRTSFSLSPLGALGVGDFNDEILIGDEYTITSSRLKVRNVSGSTSAEILAADVLAHLFKDNGESKSRLVVEGRLRIDEDQAALWFNSASGYSPEFRKTRELYVRVIQGTSEYWSSVTLLGEDGKLISFEVDGQNIPSLLKQGGCASLNSAGYRVCLEVDVVRDLSSLSLDWLGQSAFDVNDAFTPQLPLHGIE